MSTPQLKPNRGIVKQILTGDSVTIRGQPKGGPPREKTLYFSYIVAPKLGRRANNNAEETKDEPYAWEAREYLRKKLVGEEVWFTLEKSPNTTREYGCIYLGKDVATGEKVSESLVSEGLVSVRRDGVRQGPDLQRLIELEDAAKAAGRGKWAATGNKEHVRDIKWTVDNPRNFLEKYGKKPIKAVIEQVRDGSTVRVVLLPDFYHITVMLCGIRCCGPKLDSEGKPDPIATVPYAEEAKFFVESRLLQRDVEIVLESVSNNNFVGTILHPKGNIAEALLKEGFARCVDWSMAMLKSGANKLRAAEKAAKEGRIRIWKDYQATGPQISVKEYAAIVVEVVNGDALMVKTADGTVKKVFLASIRPPREQSKSSEEKPNEPLPPRQKGFRPLYDIPWMFEAREFLRKKLIGKKVNVVVDYIQTARDNFPEKVCCTITIGGVNVAETLVSKGYATVVRYRQDDDQRSSHYDELQAAEMRAAKSGAGVHAKEDIPNHRVSDISGDQTKAKSHFSSLKRSPPVKAVVEFVASGSRLRLYVDRDTCLITFLLAGITCPRGTRPGVGGVGLVDGEPFGDEALQFTKDRCLQHDVEIYVDGLDKAGNFIGWLWIDGHNLSTALVAAGLAKVHYTAERSDHYKALRAAEDNAKTARLGVWQDCVEENEEEKKIEDDQITERKIDYQKVCVVQVTPELHFYAQLVEQGANLEQLTAKIQQEFIANPPLPGAFTPKRGELCAAKFTDGKWYRARVEKVSASKVSVFYIDYGNQATVDVSHCAALPSSFVADKAYAHEYALACVELPKDEDYKEEAIQAFRDDAQDRILNLNVEYRQGSVSYATLVDVSNNDKDIAKSLILEGLLMCENCRDKKLHKLVSEYREAEDNARKSHTNMWMYGDVREDEDKEFGMVR